MYPNKRIVYLTQEQMRPGRFFVLRDPNGYRRVGRMVEVCRENGVVFKIRVVWGYRMRSELEIETLRKFDFLVDATRKEISKYKTDLKQRIADMRDILDILESAYYKVGV